MAAILGMRRRRRVAREIAKQNDEIAGLGLPAERLIYEGIRYMETTPDADADKLREHLREHATRCGFGITVWIAIAGLVLQIVVPLIIAWWKKRQEDKENEQNDNEPDVEPDDVDDDEADPWADSQ